jgi:hypothetical protein
MACAAMPFHLACKWIVTQGYGLSESAAVEDFDAVSIRFCGCFPHFKSTAGQEKEGRGIRPSMFSVTLLCAFTWTRGGRKLAPARAGVAARGDAP